MTRVFEPPVYCYHEIVHNQFVVEYFKSLGVVFINDVTTVPPGAPVMLSAHGSPPEVIEAARATGGTVVDAVCPLVTKVHHELKVRAKKGYTVLYVGHEGHEEAIGTMAVAPEAVHLIQERSDIDALAGHEGPVALLTQTTLSMDEWQDLRGLSPGSSFPTSGCRVAATSFSPPRIDRRPSKRSPWEPPSAVVIGSENSSNTMALTKVAEAAGSSRAAVNRASELPDDLREWLR